MTRLPRVLGLGEIILQVGWEYQPMAISTTEKRATYQDVLPGDGSIHHSARQSYLERHGAKLLQAV